MCRPIGLLKRGSTCCTPPHSYRSGNRCRSNMDVGCKLMDDFASSTLSKTCSTYNYKIQHEEPFSLHHNYVPSLPNHSTNCDDSSIFYTPWSSNTDEIKTTASTQVKSKVQTERNKYGSEADLYGIVSNILDEPDKAQPFLDGGFCSSILKPPWPYNINGLSDHQGLFPFEDLNALQQSLYGTESVLGTEEENVEDLYKLNDLGLDEHWLSQCQTNIPCSYNVNAKINPPGYSHPNTLSEKPKNAFQKRDALVSQLNQYNFVEDVGRYDMSNQSKNMHNKRIMTGLQDVKSCLNLSSVLPALAADTYSNIFPGKQNCQTFDDFIPDQTFTIPKTPYLAIDRPFVKDSTYVPDYDHKPDFGMKTLCSNSTAFTDFLNITPTQEQQNSDFIKSSGFKSAMSSNSAEKLLWTNGQLEGNSQSKYNNQVRSDINVLTSQKNPSVRSKYSHPCFPILPGGSAQKLKGENRTFSSLDNGYNGADKTLEGFCKSTEQHKFESLAEKRLKTLNGLYENVSNLYSSLDRNLKNTIPEKKQNMPLNVQDKNYESMVQTYKELFSNAIGYSNLRNVSRENKCLNGRQLTHPQNMYSSNGPMMGDLGSNFNVFSSSNYRSPVSTNLGYSPHPILDSNDLYSYENQSHVWPQISDLSHGDTSLQGLAAMFDTQRSAKPRNIPANELHLRLDECYDQCRALEKERKKTESVLMKHYPGKKVSSTNSSSIPRLTGNPSRVDRLVVDELREQARVVTLLGKMERFRSSPLHANISTALDRCLEAIHIVQAQRKIEIINTSNHQQKHGRLRHIDERDVVILASSIREMAVATRKARTALWCALQMTLPKSQTAQNTEEVERALLL
ncbi:hypothetical protein GDO81_013314 [Engystomops pustulosus]|uniref:Meiosis-specific coiled-coil domain-containing protein MEIOC n=2 Tax=Engystomops pustulosus TaxID=76066 RepID=A0AAV7AZH7_ENGPU|nr:hypothetical protein GDO81_013314 [Engystomops pustulosus]